METSSINGGEIKETENDANAHVLVVPYQAPGHMLPLLDLTHQLAIRGLTITILVTPKNLPILQPLLSMHPHPARSMQTLVLPFPPHPSIPLGVENMQELPIDMGLLTAMCEFYDPVLHWFQAQASPPVAILSDIFHSYWTQALAHRLGIRRIAFGPVNSCSLSAWWGRVHDISQFNIPIPSILNALANVESWGVVINSFVELEGDHLGHFKHVLGHDRVWAVGPLLPIEGHPLGLIERGGPYSVPTSEVLEWLDLCPADNSVVYVAFGSQITLSKRQMEELAKALEDSGVQFIWTIKGPMKVGTDDYGILPTGLEDRMAGRGFVVNGWAPQIEILRHRAVGAYLTHCGWNSALEGLLAGVLLLAWPMQADHYFNAKLLVDEMGVAIQVCEGLGAIPDLANLTRVLAESVNGYQLEKARARKLRETALDAVKIGGNSCEALDGLVKELCNLK